MNELALVPRRGFTWRSFLAGAAAALASAEAALLAPPLLVLYTVRAITEFGRRVLGGLNPAGAIIGFGGTVAPEGYLLCDGTAVSRTTYARLFNNISTRFGTGDGSTTFNVPELRGQFLRGRANGSANDPDRASRTAMASGGATGDNVGSVQGYATARPVTAFGTQQVRDNGTGTKLARDAVGGASVRSVATVAGDTSGVDLLAQAVSTGGDNETRPLNAYVNFIIKT